MKKLVSLIVIFVFGFVFYVNAQESQNDDVQPEPKSHVKMKSRVVTDGPIWKITAGMEFETYGISYFSKANDNPFELKNNLLPNFSVYSEEAIMTFSYGLGTNEFRFYAQVPLLKKIDIYMTCSFVPYSSKKYFGAGLQKKVANLKETKFYIFAEVGADHSEEFLSLGIRINLQEKIWKRK